MRLLSFSMLIGLAAILLGSGPASDALNPLNADAAATTYAADEAADDKPAQGRTLDKADAQRLEIRHSMIGFRNTLLFYTFTDQQAVLKLTIGNQDETFPIKGTVYLFDSDTTKEELDRWLNNQHSDGLFPEVPEPIATVALPEDICKVTAFKQTGTTNNEPTGEEFKDYRVELSVLKHAAEGKFTLLPFDDKTTVHVKSQ